MGIEPKVVSESEPISEIAKVTTITNPVGQKNVAGTQVNPATEDTLALIKTAVELIDNFISGSRGLVTEDNSSAILGQLNITLSTLRDAICAAAPNAKTLNDLYGYLARYAQLPASLSAGSNLKLSIEEATIATPSDIQARYNVKSTRDVAVPADNTSYWLPETGSIDLSNFLHSTWFIKKATNKPAAVELHISLDGGTAFAKAEGYEIATADFVLDTWNTVDCPLMLAQAKLLVTAGATGAGALNMAVIKKA